LAKWNKREDAKETDSEQIGSHPAYGRILHIFSSVPRVVRSKLCIALPVHTQQIGTKSSCKFRNSKFAQQPRKKKKRRTQTGSRLKAKN